jgi:DNA-binding LacI/PurR family transcriptional regulator
MATMSDVARQAGVSRFTVSKVLNGDLTVKAAIRARVQAACITLDFAPNPHAVSLVRGSTRALGLLVTQISDPFYAEIIEAADLEARRNGHQLVIECSYGDAALEAGIIRHFRAVRVAALVIAPVDGRANRAVLDATAEQVPVVYIDRSPRRGCHAILSDHHAAACLMTAHLLERARRPAYLGSAFAPGNFSAAERERGYRETMAAARSAPLLIPTTASDVLRDNERYGYQNMAAWLASAAAPQALFCATDAIALGAMHACAERGLTIGEDVLVAGHDDLSFSAYTTPALTTVRQPKREIATLAVETALGLVTAPSPRTIRHVLPSSLVVRRSTTPG